MSKIAIISDVHNNVEKLKQLFVAEICPYECEDEILFVAEIFQVQKHIEILTVEKLLHEEKIRKIFKL